VLLESRAKFPCRVIKLCLFALTTTPTTTTAKCTGRFQSGSIQCTLAGGIYESSSPSGPENHWFDGQPS
jgi:hypothetical protein